MNIYVGNLSRKASKDDLRQAFEGFGEITSVKIITDKITGESKGFAFIEMPSKEQAEEAIKSMNGQVFMGRPLNVNEARPKTDSRGGGGFKGGRPGDKRPY